MESADREKKLLRFEVAGQHYALDVLEVREALFAIPITSLPGSLEYLRGVINLRGAIIPVIDLSVRFGHGSIEEDQDTAIIVVEVDRDGELSLMGALVNSIRGVIAQDRSAIELPPQFGLELESKLISGISRVGEDFVVILNGQILFSAEELFRIGDLYGSDQVSIDL